MCERTKGYWIKHEKLVKKWDEYVEDIYWDCSVCGYVPYEGADYIRKNHLSNFCPNCGAKMIKKDSIKDIMMNKIILRNE